MIWLMNLCNVITKRFDKKINLSEEKKQFLFTCAATMVGLIILLPIIVAGLYNHMSGDDWYNARLVHWMLLDGDLSLKNIFITIVNELAVIYKTWSFSYGGWPCFIMPAAFGEQYVWLNVWLIMCYVLVALFVFSRKILKQVLSVRMTDCVLIFLLFLLPMIQFMPSVFAGFYWWSGSFNNTFGFALSLICIAFVVKSILFPEKNTILKWALLGVGLAWLAGTNFSSALVTLCVMMLGLVDILFCAKCSKRDKALYVVDFVVLIGFLVWAITAPGNAVRQQEIGTDAGYSFFKTIVYAFYEGMWMIYKSFNLSMIIFFIGIVWILLPYLVSSENKFSKPGLVTIVSVSIFVTTFMPTLYAQGFAGEDRLRNIQYWYCLICIIFNIIYWTGWYVKKKKITFGSITFLIKKRIVIAICFLAGMIFMIKGEQEPASKMAFRELTAGTIQQFDKELDNRESIYLAGEGNDIRVASLSNIPELYFGYTDLREERYWINSNTRDFYRLKRLRLLSEIEEE